MVFVGCEAELKKKTRLCIEAQFKVGGVEEWLGCAYC